MIEDDKLVLKLNRVEKHPVTGGGIGATVHSSRWMKYGTIEARFKTASNMPGTVSSFILISPISGDEIDFEVVGKDPSDMQTNFYYRVQPGNKVDYSHGVHVNVNLDTSLDYHTYRLDWTPTEMKWWFDGELKRTTLASEVVGSFPDTAMRVAFGIWDGGHGEKGKPLFDILVSFFCDLRLKCLVFRHLSPSIHWVYLIPLSSLFLSTSVTGIFFVSITTVICVASSCV